MTSTGIGGTGSASFRAWLAAMIKSSSRPTCNRIEAEAAHPVRVRVVGPRSRASDGAAGAGVSPRGIGAANHPAKLCRRDTTRELEWGHERGVVYQPQSRPGRGDAPQPARVTGVSSPNLARFSHRDGAGSSLSAAGAASHLFLCELWRITEALLRHAHCAAHNNSLPHTQRARIWRPRVRPARVRPHNQTGTRRCVCPAASSPL
jgi:hypothetical protein